LKNICFFWYYIHIKTQVNRNFRTSTFLLFSVFRWTLRPHSLILFDSISYHSVMKLPRVRTRFFLSLKLRTSVARTTDSSNRFWQSLRVRASEVLLYLCNKCLSPLKLWVRILLMATLSVNCGRSVVFFGYFCFLHQ
jgi:hypothetical protein